MDGYREWRVHIDKLNDREADGQVYRHMDEEIDGQINYRRDC